MSAFRASGASTGRRAKPKRFCLRCEEPVFGAGKSCDICGKPAERFDSTAEYNHFHKLRLRERAGEIFALRCHPRFELNVRPNEYNGHEGAHICYYSPDFCYAIKDKYSSRGIVVYEEIKPGKLVKSGKLKGQKKPVMTADAALKIKLFQALYNVKVNIIC